jgi:hypothetical protein
MRTSAVGLRTTLRSQGAAAVVDGVSATKYVAVVQGPKAALLAAVHAAAALPGWNPKPPFK